VRALALLAASGILVLLLFGPPLSSARAPAAPESSCVTCHTSRAMLEPLVKPLPPAPAEGEG